MSGLPRIFKQSWFRTAVTYLIGAGIAFGMWRLTIQINNAPYATATPDTEGAFEKAVEAYQGVNSMLTTFATGLLAALGFLLINLPRKANVGKEFWWAAVSATFACISLYWGYVSSQNVVVALEFQTLTLDIPSLQVPRQLQVGSILLGVICVAHFVMRTMSKANSAGGSKHAASA